MLQSLSWYAADNLARDQFRLFSDLGQQLHLNEDYQRRALMLSEQEWKKWSEFLADGPLPAEPHVPDMLQRLGTASYRLSIMAEARGMPA